MTPKQRRTPQQRAEDLERIGKLLRDELSIKEIAAAMGKSINQIRPDVAAVQKQMGNTQRTPEQIAEDRVRITEYRLKGWTQTRIAQEMNLSNAVICREFQAINEAWRTSPMSNVNEIRNEILAGMRQVISTAFEDYARSFGDHTSVEREVDPTILTADRKPLVTKVKTKTKTLLGDPRYLKIAKDAWADIAKLTGSNAPVKIEHSGEDGQPIPILHIAMDPDEL